MPTNPTVSFYNKYKDAAIAAAKGSNIFADTILAVGSLESNNGKSGLSAKHNNFFGIKPDKSWTGDVVTMKTKEQDKHGKVSVINAQFIAPKTPQECFEKFVKFVSGTRYRLAGMFTAKTPLEQFNALHKAGYATDIKYVEKLADRYDLFPNKK